MKPIALANGSRKQLGMLLNLLVQVLSIRFPVRYQCGVVDCLGNRQTDRLISGCASLLSLGHFPRPPSRHDASILEHTNLLGTRTERVGAASIY